MSELEPIRVLIADDHAIVRKGIRAVLEIVPDIEVAGQTPGKALLGLTVVRADRGPLRQGAAVVPWLGY
jgi:DNA-binding NarL/FixJ family response regulator